MKQTTLNNENFNTIQNTVPNQHKQTTQQIIQPKYPDDANIWYGESLHTPKPPNTLRIYYHNIRGAKQYESWDQWEIGHEKLRNMGTDISLLVKTNTKWNYTNINKANSTIKEKRQQLKAAMTGSDESTDSDYQPGGVYCGIHGKWTGRIIERIIDPTGLGRWAGFRFDCKNHRHIIIISTYRPTPSQDKGDNTCYSQQWRLLRNSAKDTLNPDPRTQLIKDLTIQIKKWQQDNNEIIIGIDANESLDTTNSAILRLLQDTSLTSLHRDTYAPITYARGKSCIDYILGTPTVARSIKAGGYFPFFDGAWHSDHRALYVDIDTLALFNGDPQQIVNPTPRNLQSNNRIQTNKFLEELCKNKDLPKLASQLFSLHHTTIWSNDHHEHLEQIDKYNCSPTSRKKMPKQRLCPLEPCPP